MNNGNNVDELGAEYESELKELTFNSKPLINTLTIVAGENLHNAAVIVKLIQNRIKGADPDKKLPVLYLLDSICKNIGGNYVSLFQQNIVDTFVDTFNKVNSQVRGSMLHLLKTWNGLFAPDKIQQIESITQGTSVTVAQPDKKPAIHVNPKFVNQPTKKPQPPQQKDRLDDLLSGQKNLQQRQQPQTQPQPQHRPQPVPNYPPTSSQRYTAPPASGLLPDPVAYAQQQAYPQVYPNMNPDYNPLLQQQIHQVVNEVHHQLKQQKLSMNDQLQIAEHLQRLQHPSQTPQSSATSLQLIYNILQQSQAHVVPQPFPSQSQVETDLSGLLSTLNTNVPYPTTVNMPPMPNYPPHMMPPMQYMQHGMPMGPTPPQPMGLQQPDMYGMMKPPVQVPQMVPPQPQPVVPKTVAPSTQMPLANKDLFSPEILKSRQEAVINSLYHQFPLQCKNCGLRFADRDRMDKHLDWHFQQNRKEKERSKKAMSRSWYATLDEWIMDTDVSEKRSSPFFNDQSKPDKETREQVFAVPADDKQPNCPACGEKFEQYYDNEEDEWMYKDAVSVNGVIYHQKCQQPTTPIDTTTPPESSVSHETQMPDTSMDDTKPETDGSDFSAKRQRVV